ncbi:hypothetical protein AMTR_s00071p00070980 [Amborella trichopoda]|uniref:Uncharacterized protein n=1 Tax=Amborella trichopoda TaxID=13333 RepID=U5DHE3_AMBTC|nr:hypothetical protein AMTR_s00071p00070980 [Amborella trichopoda]
MKRGERKSVCERERDEKEGKERKRRDGVKSDVALQVGDAGQQDGWTFLEYRRRLGRSNKSSRYCRKYKRRSLPCSASNYIPTVPFHNQKPRASEEYCISPEALKNHCRFGYSVCETYDPLEEKNFPLWLATFPPSPKGHGLLKSTHPQSFKGTLEWRGSKGLIDEVGLGATIRCTMLRQFPLKSLELRLWRKGSQPKR